MVIQKLVPAIQKLVPASQKLPAIQKLLPASAIQKLSAIQMLLVLRARLLFGRRNHTGRLGKRSRTQSRIGRRTGRRRTGLRRAGNRSGRRRAGRRRAERRRTGRRKIQEYWGGNAWEKHYLPDAWKKERGSKGKKRKAWIEGQIMSLKQEGRWVGSEPSASSKQLRLMREDCWFCSICMLGGE